MKSLIGLLPKAYKMETTIILSKNLMQNKKSTLIKLIMKLMEA